MRFAAAAFAIALIGCGGRRSGAPDSGLPPPDGWLEFDAAMLARDGGVHDGDDGDAGAADAGTIATVDGVLTNEPTVGYVNDGPPELHLVTSSFVHPYASLPSFVWIGEVRNDGTRVVCPDVRIDIGSTGVASTAFYGQKHMLRSTTDPTPGLNSCIDPGDVGIATEVYDFPIDTVRAQGTLHYVVFDYRLDEVLDPARPTIALDPAMHHTDDDRWHATGTIHASTYPVHNFALYIFPRDASGLLGDWVAAFVPGTVTASSTTSFTTGSGAPFEFTSAVVFPSYLRGP